MVEDPFSAELRRHLLSQTANWTCTGVPIWSTTSGTEIKVSVGDKDISDMINNATITYETY